jgi:hypothetical protein
MQVRIFMITDDHSFRKIEAWNEAYPSLGPREQLIYRRMASASSSRRPITRYLRTFNDLFSIPTSVDTPSLSSKPIPQA